jgi:hypothetical protein
MHLIGATEQGKEHQQRNVLSKRRRFQSHVAQQIPGEHETTCGMVNFSFYRTNEQWVPLFPCQLEQYFTHTSPRSGGTLWPVAHAQDDLRKVSSTMFALVGCLSQSSPEH